MLALTALLALIAIVVLHVVEHRKREAEKRSAHLFYDRLNQWDAEHHYRRDPDYTDWREWDWPIPEDGDWNFPDRDAV